MNRQQFRDYATKRGIYEAGLVAQIAGVPLAVVQLWSAGQGALT